jgi:hypothetical protein
MRGKPRGIEHEVNKNRGWQLTSPFFYFSSSICAQAASAGMVRRGAGRASAETAPAVAGYSSAARAVALNAALRAQVFADSASAPAACPGHEGQVPEPVALPGTSAAAQAGQCGSSAPAHALPDFAAGGVPAPGLCAGLAAQLPLAGKLSRAAAVSGAPASAGD